VSGTYRTKEELDENLKRDPIALLRVHMQDRDEISDEELAALDEELKAAVQDAWDFADQSPEPPPEALWEDVYVDTTSDAVGSETAVAAD
jgi:pyruvate dehydrogenase E1 component alpha subunit